MIRRLINRLRGGRVPPQWQVPLGRGVEHDDWQRGDLAECITSGDWLELTNGHAIANAPQTGVIYRVRHVGMLHGFHILWFFEMPHAGWNAECFQKLRPNNREACKPAFANQMRRLGRKVDA